MSGRVTFLLRGAILRPLEEFPTLGLTPSHWTFYPTLRGFKCQTGTQSITYHAISSFASTSRVVTSDLLLIFLPRCLKISIIMSQYVLFLFLPEIDV